MFLADARIEPTPWRCVCGTAGLSRETAALAWLPGASADLPNFGRVSTLPLFRAPNRRGSETLDDSGGPTGLAESNGGRNVIGARRANPASPAGAR